MDRRTFLRAVIGIEFGIGIKVPNGYSFDAAPETEIESLWSVLAEDPVAFEVDSYGTLAAANYPEPLTRGDVFALSAGWIKSTDDLIDELERCPPLAWRMGAVCEDLRDEALGIFEDELSDELESDEVRALLAAEEAKWPRRDHDDELIAWIRRVDAGTFEKLLQAVRAWLDSEPDWGHEADYYTPYATGQSAALEFFQTCRPSVCELLQIEIVEGEYPGSTYYAAELHMDVETANAVAARQDIPVKFVRLR